MLTKKRFILFGLIALVMTLLLGACAIGQQPEITPDVVDVDAIYTSAAATAIAQMTELASIATPTLPPTATPTSDMPLVQVTPLADDPDDDNETPPDSATITPTRPPITAAPGVGGTPAPECNSAAFEGETIPDGTIFMPNVNITKVWKFRNTGTCTWTDGYSFRFVDGERMGGVDYYFIGENNHVAPGETVNVSINIRTPMTSGRMVGYWQLFSDQATNFMRFGWPVYIDIEIKE